MARLRYVKGAPAGATQKPGAFKIRHDVKSIRALYETEPEIAAALLPKPLEPAAPEIFVQFAHIQMHLAEDRVVEIGAATVGVSCTHEDKPGYYVLAMPMEGEFVVIGGREKFGEPKKIAKTRFSMTDSHVNGQIERHGVTFLELDGDLGEEIPDAPKQFMEHFYCFKALPTCQPDTNENGGFDGEVLLTQLNWERNYTSVRQIENGKIILRESAKDPLIDVPVKKLLKMEFAQGATRTGGEVVRTVPGEWLAPFICQRFDDANAGVEIELASDKKDQDA